MFELTLPTPVVRLPIVGGRGELWLKNDGLSHPRYGGNKARKAALLLEQAASRGARRVLTFGAAGSHHVLATALFAQEFGLGSAAVLTPQPDSAHARAVLSRALSTAITLYPAPSTLAVPLALARALRRGDSLIAPGGSSPHGARAYLVALLELEAQVSAGALPEPDWIVTPLGSGGTAAGLLAGLACSRLKTRLLAVSVLSNPVASHYLTWLASRTLRAAGHTPRAADWPRRLCVDRGQVGAGYGRATSAGALATREAREFGLDLDPTYTAKAFAAALSLARGEHPASRTAERVVYWHTLNAVPEVQSSASPSLPPALARLLTR